MSNEYPEKSIVDRILYVFASLLVKFYSESTRKWAEDTIERLEGREVREITREEALDHDSIPDQALIFNAESDDGEDTLKIFAGDEKTRGLTALVIALKHRLKQYWVIFLVPIILFLITEFLGQSISLANIGIYFDLFGAIIVVRGLYRTPTEIDYESALTLPQNPMGDPVDRLITAVETIDSMFGSLLLTLGFALQLLAASNILFSFSIILMILIVWLGIR